MRVCVCVCGEFRIHPDPTSEQGAVKTSKFSGDALGDVLAGTCPPVS